MYLYPIAHFGHDSDAIEVKISYTLLNRFQIFALIDLPELELEIWKLSNNIHGDRINIGSNHEGDDYQTIIAFTGKWLMIAYYRIGTISRPVTIPKFALECIPAPVEPTITIGVEECTSMELDRKYLQ